MEPFRCMSQRNVDDQAETFKPGRKGLSDVARSENLPLSRAQDSNERVKDLIRKNRSIIVFEVAEMLEFRQTETYNLQQKKRTSVKTDLLNLKNVCPPCCSRNNTNNSKPQVRGSATSTSQFIPHAVRLSGLRSSKLSVILSPVWH